MSTSYFHIHFLSSVAQPSKQQYIWQHPQQNLWILFFFFLSGCIITAFFFVRGCDLHLYSFDAKELVRGESPDFCDDVWISCGTSYGGWGIEQGETLEISRWKKWQMPWDFYKLLTWNESCVEETDRDEQVRAVERSWICDRVACRNPWKPVSALKILRTIMRLFHVCSHFLSATFWKTCVLRFYDMSCLFISTPHVFAYEKPTEFAQKPHVLVSIAEKLLWIHVFKGKNHENFVRKRQTVPTKETPPKIRSSFFSDSTGLDSTCWIRLAQDAQQEVLRPLLRPMLQRLHKEAGSMISSAIVGRATPQTFNIDTTNGHI